MSANRFSGADERIRQNETSSSASPHPSKPPCASLNPLPAVAALRPSCRRHHSNRSQHRAPSCRALRPAHVPRILPMGGGHFADGGSTLPKQKGSRMPLSRSWLPQRSYASETGKITRSTRFAKVKRSRAGRRRLIGGSRDRVRWRNNCPALRHALFISTRDAVLADPTGRPQKLRSTWLMDRSSRNMSPVLRLPTPRGTMRILAVKAYPRWSPQSGTRLKRATLPCGMSTPVLVQR